MQSRDILAKLVASLLLAGAARAAPPPDSNLQYKDWFESLRQPGTLALCCTISDCRVTAYRMSADGYEVPINSHWVRVPADTILNRTDNPTGNGVVCYTPPEHIICFVRATDG